MPERGQPMYKACAPGGRFVVAALLSDLSVDLLLRGDKPVVSREPRSVFASIASSDVIEHNPELVHYLDALSPLRLSRFDTATGTMRMDVDDEQRSFTSGIRVGDVMYELRIGLPGRVEGGYWRTPGVLQMAFWSGQRPDFHVTGPAGVEIAAELECLAVSTDGLRLVTAGSTPDIFIGFYQCE